MSFPRYPTYKDSGVEWLGELPQHWALSKGRRLFTQEREAARPTDDQLSATQKYGVIPQNLFMEMEDQKVALALSGLENFKHVEAGDFVISLRSFQGGIERSAYAGCVSPAYTVLRPVESVVGKFWSYLLKSKGYIEALQTMTDGIRDGKTISYQQFGQIVVPVIPPVEQVHIAAFLDRETARIDELVAEQRRLMELLKEKREAVIARTVTKGLSLDAPLKPSGVEWIGDVPRSWLVIKLGRAVFMQEGPGLRTWQFTDGGVRVICVTNITEAGIDFSRLEKFISVDEYNSTYRHFTVRRGDVLLSSSGNSWGKVSIFNGDEDVILNTSTIRLNEVEGSPLKRTYIAILLQSDMVREQLALAMTGSCQPNFGPTHLNSVMVAIPERAEQDAIVEYLNAEFAKLDALTREAQRAIDLLQERRTALISAAVTGQIDVRALPEKRAA
jgi:type I restriction enzyme S subunit